MLGGVGGRSLTKDQRRGDASEFLPAKAVIFLRTTNTVHLIRFICAIVWRCELGSAKIEHILMSER